MFNSKYLLSAAILAGAALSHAGWTLAEYPGKIVAFTSISPSNSGWALDPTNPIPGGNFALRRFSNSTSSLVSPSAGLADLDIIGNNRLWGVNKGGDVFRNFAPIAGNGGTWEQVGTPAPARRIATGNNDAIFILTNEVTAGGFKLYKYDGFGVNWTDWQAISAGLTEIDVDDNGDLWGVNNEKKVFRLAPGNISGTWQLKSNSDTAINIAAGKGNIYILTSNLTPGGHSLKRWNGSSFSPISGGLNDIQVDASGRLWGANNENKIFNYVP